MRVRRIQRFRPVEAQTTLPKRAADLTFRVAETIIIINMSPKVEKQILEKLERIEDLLVKFVPIETELTEQKVINFVKEGRTLNRKGKTRKFDEFVGKDHPHLVKK